VAVEPGRWMTILEPQAVAQLMAQVISYSMYRPEAEQQGVFNLESGQSKIGLPVFDRRITIASDPMDPEAGFPPFDINGVPYQKVNWVEEGVLKELFYDRRYALRTMGKPHPLLNSQAFRVSGGTATLESMIASTQRGLIVTRFHDIEIVDRGTLLCSGTTRDGVWVIERGKITKPAKNFRFTESPMFAFNNVEELGAPVRVLAPFPTVVPPMKIRDFSFTSMADAV
jgi:predicted Zn-dependent protease